mgnify:CR=1 FL=1
MKNLIKTICSISVFALILTSCGDGGKKASTVDATKKQGFVKLSLGKKRHFKIVN